MRLIKIVLFTLTATISFTSIFAQKKKADSLSFDREFSLTAYYYSVPQDADAMTFIGTADINQWHMEGRFNYEDRNTGSIFGGYTFSTKGKLEFDITPMLGIVFGNSNGIAPGLELNLNYKKFNFYSESEYMIYYQGYTKNFIYTWNELTYTAFKNFDVGISAQKTLLYETGRSIQRGIFARYSFWKLTAAVYYFNPFSEDNLWIFSLGVNR